MIGTRRAAGVVALLFGWGLMAGSVVIGGGSVAAAGGNASGNGKAKGHDTTTPSSASVVSTSATPPTSAPPLVPTTASAAGLSGLNVAANTKAGGATTSVPDPGKGKSNNGDVKIHDVGDPSFPPQENDPHVDCPFDIVFFNFDTGQNLIVTLEGQPPSAPVETTVVYGPHLYTAGAEDGSGKNGSPIRIKKGDLDLSKLTPFTEKGNNDWDDKQANPNHNSPPDRDELTYHLKLDVKTMAGVELFKHKVFWVGDCTVPPLVVSSTTTGPQGTTTVPQGTTTSPQGTTTTTPAAVLGEQLTRTPPAGPSVLGRQLSRHLAFTGENLRLALFAAGLLLSVGGLAVAGSRSWGRTRSGG